MFITSYCQCGILYHSLSNFSVGKSAVSFDLRSFSSFHETSCQIPGCMCVLCVSVHMCMCACVHEQSMNHISLNEMASLNVMQSHPGCISANTRPHQPYWSDQEMRTGYLMHKIQWPTCMSYVCTQWVHVWAHVERRKASHHLPSFLFLPTRALQVSWVQNHQRYDRLRPFIFYLG